jgi:hypothetical protein
MPKPKFEDWFKEFRHEEKNQFEEMWHKFWNILILKAYPPNNPFEYDTDFELNQQDKREFFKMIKAECKIKLKIKHSYWLRKNKKLSECEQDVWLVIQSMMFYIDCKAEDGKGCNPNHIGLSLINESKLKF